VNEWSLGTRNELLSLKGLISPYLGNDYSQIEQCTNRRGPVQISWAGIFLDYELDRCFILLFEQQILFV
jgi:hypothetical protein